MSYKRIFVAVDGSETSELAVVEASHLASILKAKMCVIIILEEFPIYNAAFGIDLIQYQERIRKDAEAILNRMLELAKKSGVSAEAQLIEMTMREWKISEKILEAAQNWRSDLLVIGTHGRRGFRRFLLGSVAEEIIRTSSIPILLIRSKEKA